MVHLTITNHCMLGNLAYDWKLAVQNGNAPSSISELLTARNSNSNLRGDAIFEIT